jgi:hypothetical protein
MTALDLEISYRVARYITGGDSLAEFRRWLLPVVWDIAEPGSDEVSQLASRIELRLAEFMNGHWTEDDLRTHFALLVPATGSVAADVTPTALSGSSAAEPAESLRPPSAFVPA